MAATLLACKIGPNDLADWIEHASSEERAIAVDGALRSAEQLRERGRPPGTPGQPAFDAFVSTLYFFAAHFGGQPGDASRKGNNPVEGNIPRILRNLDDMSMLPQGFIPAEGSILKAVKRAAENWTDSNQAT